MAEFAGKSYTDLLNLIVEAALERTNAKIHPNVACNFEDFTVLRGYWFLPWIPRNPYPG